MQTKEKTVKQKLIGKYGVYAILINGIIRYIGSGGLESRKSNHLSRLRKGTHNAELVKLFNEFGEESFDFYVLDYCNKSSCFELERLYKKIHEDTIVKGNEIRTTKKKVRRGKEASNHKKKFSELNTGVKNPNAQLSDQDVKEILFLKSENVSRNFIADKYGISAGHVYNIGKYKWLHIDINEKVKPDWFDIQYNN